MPMKMAYTRRAAAGTSTWRIVPPVIDACSERSARSMPGSRSSVRTCSISSGSARTADSTAKNVVICGWAWRTAIVYGAPVAFMHVGRAAAAALHLRAAYHPLQHANQQIALAAEVVIQRAFGEFRLRGDQLGGGAIEAARGEHGRRRIEDMPHAERKHISGAPCAVCCQPYPGE